MGDVLEVSSLITSNETTHTARDQSALRGPPLIPQIPLQLSEDRAFTQRFTQPELKTKDALKCIPQLNIEDDIGVDEFIEEVRKMRAMCSEQHLLLKTVTTIAPIATTVTTASTPSTLLDLITNEQSRRGSQEVKV